ncbi:MAG: SRPBCC family protein [Woeseiaceae bacterium]|nr:SRPBCC family protein [Woeseiaceae bacterium]
MPGRDSLLLLLAIATIAVTPVRAEITHAAANGFEVVVTTRIEASREAVWRGFVDEIARWWNPDHTVSGRAEGLYLDARTMGCFCELLGPDNGVVHMIVTLVDKPHMLRLTGGLGPLGLKGVAGNMTVEIDEADGVSTVVLYYAVGGFHEAGLDSVAPAVDAVLGELLERLAEHVTDAAPEAQRSRP